MARQGNYVSVPGGSANWSKDFSSSLSDLSKSLIAQGDTEAERIRLAQRAKDDMLNRTASRVDSIVRQQEEDAYRKARDEVLDARASAAAAESKRRWDLQEERRATAERERLEALKGERTARAALWELATNPDAVTFEDADLPSYLKDSYDTITTGLTNEQNAVRNYLQSEGNDIQAASAAYRTRLEGSDLPPRRVDELVAQREAELMGLKDQFTFGDEDPAKGIASFMADRYGSRFNEINENIRTGAGLTQDQKVAALLGDLSPEVRQYLDVADAKELLGGIVTGPTRESLIQGEKDRVDALNATMLKNIELYDDYLGRANAASKGKSYSSTTKGVADALQDMGKVDIGWIDTDRAKDGFNLLISKGIDPEIAAASVAFGIDRGWLGDSFPSTTSEEFAKIEQQAQLLQQGKRTGTGGSVYIDRNAYVYKPESARGLEELQRGLIRFSPQESSLDVNPEFRLPAATYAGQERFNAAMEAAAKAEETPPPAEEPPAEEPGAGTVEVQTLPPLEMGAGTSGPTGPGVDALKAELGDALDLEWPQMKYNQRGQPVGLERGLNEQEILSREVLSAYEAAANGQAKLEQLRRVANNPGLVGIMKMNANTMVSTQERMVQDQLEKLEALKLQLLAPSK